MANDQDVKLDRQSSLADTKPASPQTEYAPPAQLGQVLLSRYRIESQLGRGGLGVVYRAKDLQLHRDVAIKFLRTQLDEEHRSRLLAEARAAASLNHPNVVTVHDVGQYGDQPFVVMEFVAGGNLKLAGLLDFQTIAEIALQLCRALQHVHDQGIVHRDIKPENILVADASMRQVKLGDLGLAISKLSARTAPSGTIVGTPAYMAPELALARKIDHRVDLYSLGVVLYELIAGRQPFDGPDPVSIVSMHLNAPVVPPRSFRADVPAGLEELVLKLLAKDPDERYQTADEVLAAIQRIRLQPHADVPLRFASVRMLESLVRGRLVGRDLELRQLRGLWQRAHHGQGHIAILQGEPGCGKTRLAREIAVYAEVDGAKVLHGACYELDQAVPYQAIVEALERWSAKASNDDIQAALGSSSDLIARLVPALAKRLGSEKGAPRSDSAEERANLFEQIGQLLRRLAQPRGLLLFIDDLQWADCGTLALLRFLSRQLTRDPWLVVATLRDAEVERTEPLATALEDWNRQRLVTQIPLGRLSPDWTQQMIRTLMGEEPISGQLADLIFRESDGNPFFVEELVKALIDEGALERTAGRWQIKPSAEVTLPPSIKSAIGRRFDRLSEPSQRALTIAAALGKQFQYVHLFAAWDNQDENQLLDAMDEAVCAQLITARDAESFAFTHDKIREVVYAELNPVRRVRLHAQIGAALDGLFQSNYPVAIKDLAFHYFEGGDCHCGMHYGFRAAEEAEAVYAYDTALKLYRRALTCATGADDRPQMARIQSAMGRIYAAIGNCRQAADHLNSALQYEADDTRRIDIRLEIGDAYTRIGDAQGQQVLRQLIEELQPERHPLQFARAQMMIGRYHHYRGQHRLASKLLMGASSVAERLGQHSIACDIYAYLSAAYQHLTRYDQSNQWAEKCISLGRANGHLQAVAQGFEFLAENACCQGRWNDALRFAEMDASAGREIHSIDRVAWAGYSRGFALHGLGQLGEAEKVLEDNLDRAEQIEEPRLMILLASVLAAVKSDQGSSEEAQSIANHAIGKADKIELVWGRIESRRALAIVYLAQKQWEKSLELFSVCRQLLQGSDNRQCCLLFSPVAIRARIALGQLDQAAEDLSRFRQRAVDAQAVHGQAVAALLDANLAIAAGQPPRQVDAQLDAAVHSLEKTESQVELVRALATRADWRMHNGQTQLARQDGTRARELAAQLGMPRANP